MTVVACSCCGHVFNRRDLKPGEIVRCKPGPVPVVSVAPTAEETS